MKKIKHKNLSLYATPEEVKKVKLIGAYHSRRTFSDTMRFLIQQESEKILSASANTSAQRQS